MKSTDLISGIRAFFMDILVFLIPGSVLLAITSAFLATPPSSVLQGSIFNHELTATGWLAFCVASYLIGYVLQAIGETGFLPAAAFSKTHGPRLVGKFLDLVLPGLKPQKALESEWEGEWWFAQLREVFSRHTNTSLSKAEFRELRDVALSLASGKTEIVYRFRSMSDLCLNTAVALVVATVVAVVFSIVSLIPAAGVSFGMSRLWWLIPLVLFTAGLLNRRCRYFQITMKIPFWIALAEVARLENSREKAADAT